MQLTSSSWKHTMLFSFPFLFFFSYLVLVIDLGSLTC
jgi:hypothetical protein